MKKIGVVVDQGADIPSKITEKHKIEVVPVKLDWPEVEPLPGDNIFQKMQQAEERGMETFGKTSQPSPKAFLNAYKKQLESFEEIICVTITSKLSGTYNSALQAKNFLPSDKKNNVYVVDSLSVSGGEALLALRAIDYINQGMAASKIAEKLQEERSEIKARLVLKELKWVEAAGRISPTVASWGKKMQQMGIRPVLGFKDGVLKAVGVKVGAKEAYNALFKDFRYHLEKEPNKKARAIITHGDDDEAVEELTKLIKKNFPKTDIVYTNLINDIVGTLGGPGALALCWMES
ncbi:MAG: DegV family EDD domain-containing protein [Candidatus Nealsonbacteria bacterium]|nr:DegV family EDD domain-containing protein [Candidatus Nealsonbacteria bacterium]